jgi:peptidoglycan/LPS O-acetylase OafA/YrhL
MDGLRALASNLVVLSHVILVFFNNELHFWGRGLAVTFLFILSGFLITQSLLIRSQKPGPHLPNFLADRMARILTPLVPVMLMIALLNATVIESRMGGDGLNTGFIALAGNLLLLFDYPVFQALSIVGMDVPWRIRPYNTAEPYWTVAIEFWLYVAAGLLVYVLLLKEPIRRHWALLLALVSLPVLVWNAADGAGKALSLIWILGGVAGFIVVRAGRDTPVARSRSLWLWLTGFGVVALAGRMVKIPFDPYDLQTAFLIVVIFLGVFLRLNRATTAWKVPAKLSSFLASYSYSLYLVHNTVLVLVFEATRDTAIPKAAAVAIAVALAHGIAWLVYQAFEKRHRTVGSWLRPRLNRALLPAAAVAAAQPAAASTAGASAAAPHRPVAAPAPLPGPASEPSLAPSQQPSPAEVLTGAVAAAASTVAAGLAAATEVGRAAATEARLTGTTEPEAEPGAVLPPGLMPQ